MLKYPPVSEAGLQGAYLPLWLHLKCYLVQALGPQLVSVQKAVEPLGGSTLLEIVEQVLRVCRLSQLPVYVLLGDCGVSVSEQLPSSSGSHACSAVDGL